MLGPPDRASISKARETTAPASTYGISLTPASLGGRRRAEGPPLSGFNPALTCSHPASMWSGTLELREGRSLRERYGRGKLELLRDAELAERRSHTPKHLAGGDPLRLDRVGHNDRIGPAKRAAWSHPHHVRDPKLVRLAVVALGDAQHAIVRDRHIDQLRLPATQALER
jgi:hypothetical protein